MVKILKLEEFINEMFNQSYENIINESKNVAEDSNIILYDLRNYGQEFIDEDDSEDDQNPFSLKIFNKQDIRKAIEGKGFFPNNNIEKQIIEKLEELFISVGGEETTKTNHHVMSLKEDVKRDYEKSAKSETKRFINVKISKVEPYIGKFKSMFGTKEDIKQFKDNFGIKVKEGNGSSGNQGIKFETDLKGDLQRLKELSNSISEDEYKNNSISDWESFFKERSNDWKELSTILAINSFILNKNKHKDSIFSKYSNIIEFIKDIKQVKKSGTENTVRNIQINFENEKITKMTYENNTAGVISDLQLIGNDGEIFNMSLKTGSDFYIANLGFLSRKEIIQDIKVIDIDTDKQKEIDNMNQNSDDDTYYMNIPQDKTKKIRLIRFTDAFLDFLKADKQKIEKIFYRTDSKGNRKENTEIADGIEDAGLKKGDKVNSPDIKNPEEKITMKGSEISNIVNLFVDSFGSFTDNPQDNEIEVIKINSKESFIHEMDLNFSKNLKDVLMNTSFTFQYGGVKGDAYAMKIISGNFELDNFKYMNGTNDGINAVMRMELEIRDKTESNRSRPDHILLKFFMRKKK